MFNDAPQCWNSLKNNVLGFRFNKEKVNEQSIIQDQNYSLNHHSQDLYLSLKSRVDNILDQSQIESQLYEAYKINIKIGQFQQACECLIKLNQWQKAISIAPSVSMSFWKEISLKYAEHLKKSSPQISTNFYSLQDENSKAIEVLKEAGLKKQSLLIAILKKDQSTKKCFDKNEIFDSNKKFDIKVNENIQDLVHQQAGIYFQNKNYIQAVQYHLNFNDYESAVVKLIKAQLFFHAYYFSKLLNLKNYEELCIQLLFQNNPCQELYNCLKAQDQQLLQFAIQKVDLEYLYLSQNIVDQFDVESKISIFMNQKNYDKAFKLILQFDIPQLMKLNWINLSERFEEILPSNLYQFFILLPYFRLFAVKHQLNNEIFFIFLEFYYRIWKQNDSKEILFYYQLLNVNIGQQTQIQKFNYIINLAKQKYQSYMQILNNVLQKQS